MSTSATVTLETVKHIDTKTKYIVDGFVRRAQKLFPSNIVQYTISTLIIHWILLYYYQQDEFDPTKHTDSYVLTKNNTLVTLYQDMNGNGSAYLSKIARSGIHKWKFKLIRANDDDWYMSIGVFNLNHTINIKKRVDNFYNNEAYGWIVNSQDALRGRGSQGRYCEKRYVTGDIIEMILDLNKMELRYIANEEDLGAVVTNIPKAEYKAVVSMNWERDQIELLSYSVDY